MTFTFFSLGFVDDLECLFFYNKLCVVYPEEHCYVQYLSRGEKRRLFLIHESHCIFNTVQKKKKKSLTGNVTVLVISWNQR